jgi:hypothetical protein
MNLFLYFILNAAIIPASNGANLEVVLGGKNKISIDFDCNPIIICDDA